MERKTIIINSVIIIALVLASVTNKSAQNTVKTINPILQKTPGFSTEYPWKKLDTPAFKGKQDDIFFITPEIGWYVNGAGMIYKTTDGGAKWIEKLHQPGTYFRCIGFIDERRGFAGNICPDYFPNVTDTVPLYKTPTAAKRGNLSISTQLTSKACAPLIF